MRGRGANREGNEMAPWQVLYSGRMRVGDRVGTTNLECGEFGCGGYMETAVCMTVGGLAMAYRCGKCGGRSRRGVMKGKGMGIRGWRWRRI